MDIFGLDVTMVTSAFTAVVVAAVGLWKAVGAFLNIFKRK